MLFATCGRRYRAALSDVLLSCPTKSKQNLESKKPDKQNSPKTQISFLTHFCPPDFHYFLWEKSTLPVENCFAETST